MKGRSAVLCRLRVARTTGCLCRLCSDQRRDVLMVHHPGSSNRTPVRDQFLDNRKVGGQRTSEDGLVVSNPIAKQTNLLKLRVDRFPLELNRARCRQVRQYVVQMWHPKPSVVPAGKHALPKNELEFCDDLACRCETRCDPCKFHTRVEGWLLRTWKAQPERVVPRPVRSVSRLERVAHCVTDHYFTEMKRVEES